MKKLISFVIAISVLLSISVRAEEKEITLESTDIETISATMQKKVAVLSAIDILRGYEDGSFRLNQKITRAEFAVLVVRALGYEDLAMGEGAKSVSFADTEGHWAVENIEFAKSLGLFSGSDGYFYPDNYITGNEAIKVMVCMLGYGDIAESEGGWTKGYYKIATNLGILKEVEDGYLTAETVNRSFVIAALFNTLNTSALGVDLSSGMVNYTPNGETILENVHKVYNSNGKITATKYTDLYSNRRGTKDGTVVIGEENYYAGTTNAHDLIGYNVEFYYRTEGMDDYKTLIYITPRSMCAEKVIQASEIDKVEGSRLYYGASGRSVEIEKSALVFYNKRAYPDYSVNDLKIDDGELKFLDSDGNGKYDIIFINEFINIVLPIPFICSIILNEMVAGKNFVRISTYLPAVIPAVAVSLIWTNMYMEGPGGLLNMFLGFFGAAPRQWLMNKSLTIPLIIISMTWQGFGSTLLYYFAMLQSVNVELFDAARIDGAGVFSRAKNVIMPHMMPLFLLMAIKQIITVFQVIDQPLIMTGGGPNGASLSLSLLGYQYAFQFNQTGKSLAVNFITFLMLIGLTFVYFKAEKKISA